MTDEEYGEVFGIEALCDMFRFRLQKQKIRILELKD